MSELSLQDKIPPQNLEMEQAVLGSILVSPTCIVEAMSVLGPNDFHRPAHTLLWQALTKMHSKSLPIDLLTVKQFLEERSHTDRYGEHHDFLDDCGGWEYIVRLTDAVPSAANIKHYCLSVREASVRRGIETVSRKMQQMAHDEGRPADSLMSYCFNELAGLAQRFARYGRAYSMEEAVRGLYDETEERYNTPQNERGTLGAPCGIQVVDYATNGWQPGDMIVLAARPSVGKTALGTQFAVNAALEGYPAVFFSYEMTERALTRRIVSNCARVDSRVIARATMNDDQWVQFRKSCERCSAMPLTIVDASGMTVPEMEVEIRRLPDTRLVVVDYCALIPSVEQYGNKDYLRVTEISHAIKAMAVGLTNGFDGT